MTIDVDEERSLLLQEMKVTKGSRFNAAERLRRRDRSRTTITAFASVYVIILTLIPAIFHLSDTLGNIITIIIIVFSIVVLTSSLLQYPSADPVRAEQHHRCALEINALRRELRTAEPSTISMIQEFSRKYDDILQKYNANHEPVDFERYKIEHPDEYPMANLPEGKATLQADINLENRIGRSVLQSMTAAVLFALLFAVVPLIMKMLGSSGTLMDLLRRIFG